MLAVIAFSVITLGVASFSSNVDLVVQSIGFLSLSIEAVLGLPQAYNNFERRSVRGMSLGLIGGWFAGDASKTVYFVIKGAPLQFLLCGVFQLLVDFLIVFQMFFYSSA